MSWNVWHINKRISILFSCGYYCIHDTKRTTTLNNQLISIRIIIQIRIRVWIKFGVAFVFTAHGMITKCLRGMVNVVRYSYTITINFRPFYVKRSLVFNQFHSPRSSVAPDRRKHFKVERSLHLQGISSITKGHLNSGLEEKFYIRSHICHHTTVT